MLEDDVNRLLGENLKMMRSLIFMKREIILLRSEREDRERTILSISSEYSDISNRFKSLEKSYKNIKEVQDHLSYQNATLIETNKKLESLVSYMLEKIDKIDANNNEIKLPL